MAKHMGWSANRSSIAYVRDNSDVMYLLSDSANSATAGNIVVSAVVSSADFAVASAAQGAVMTIGAKNSQSIEGSGNATHLALQTVSGGRRLLLTTVSAQVLASGNTVNIASWTVTANASANNA
jgi:hypothetical protein